MPAKPWAIKCSGSSIIIPITPVIFEDHSGTPDGTYPISQEELQKKSYWKFKEWYPRCCAACSLNGLYPIQEYRWHGAAIAVPEELTSSTEEMEIGITAYNNKKCFNSAVHIDDLPDHVLVSVFENIHKVELIRAIPLVSKRWQRLMLAPRLWRELRIAVCNEPACLLAVRAFLGKVGRFIKKMCVYVLNCMPIPEIEFINLFPNCMVSVTVLDVGFLCYLTVPVVRFLIRCFPNVEKLNVEGLKKVEEGAFKLLFSDGFPRLQELILSHCESLTLQDFEVLCRKRPLKVLSIDGILTLQSFAGLTLAESCMVSSLSRLYLDGEEMYDAAFAAIACCHNLKLLSVSYCESATNLSLRYIKALSNLEHLHLRKGKEFTEEGLKEFFKLSNGKNVASSSFPGKLKYLNFGECPGINDAVLDLLTTSCPDLVSLCLVWCWSVTDVGFTKLVERLSRLEFLDISGMDCIDGRALLEVPRLYLKNLRYLGAEQCPAIEDSTLQILNLQKKDLIVSNYHNYFITFELRSGVASFGERLDKQFQEAVNNRLSWCEGYCCLS